MSSVKGKWTEKVVCGTNAEAQVKKDEFKRKGMLSRIRRNPARYEDGMAIGGTFIVQARIPKKGLNTYGQDPDALPLLLVKWPLIIEHKIRTQTGRDFRGKPTYEETIVKTAGIEVRAMRIAENEVADAIVAQQEKVDEELAD